MASCLWLHSHVANYHVLNPNSLPGKVLTPLPDYVIVLPRNDCGALPEEKGPARKAGSNCGGATPPGASTRISASHCRLVTAGVSQETTVTRATPKAVHTVYEERPRKAACVQDELLGDGSMILYNTCKRELLTLNPTAALIWECCDGAHNIPAICAEIHDVFPDRTDVYGDVLNLLQDLLERGMIVDEGL